MENKIYTLSNIAEWQSITSKISLPKLQRGFVWRPNQIEALWDSIFRGYPIGAVLMSFDGVHRNLLDGQQRCTSIALGHLNPYEENNENFLSLKEYKPMIWIDLKPSHITNNHRYVFRVLTQSHPWGYQRTDNSKTLSMGNRKKALQFFNNESEVNYTALTTDKINPWDANYPIPLQYLLNIKAINKDDFIQKIRSLINIDFNNKIKTQYSNDNYVDYNLVTDDDLIEIYYGYKNYLNCNVPEILVSSDVLKIDENELNSKNSNEMDPTLFVRVNSAGTRISGEELNYSIFKAYFPESKDLVEDIKSNFISPTKIISLFSRLSYAKQNNWSYYVKEFNVNDFRKRIKDEEFQKNMLNYINNGRANELLENAIKVIYNNVEEEKYPKALVKQLLVSNLDLTFNLLVFLERNDEYNISEVAAYFSIINWFKAEKNIGNSLFEKLKDSNSWKASYLNLVKERKVKLIVKPELLRENLKNIIINQLTCSDDWADSTKKYFSNELIKYYADNDFKDDEIVNSFREFINTIYWNKSLLIFAQRNYIVEKFKEYNQFESIEDTNRPWDWDHIYPASWIYNKENIAQIVKNWKECIGNYRALSFDDNRSESNNVSPKERFSIDNNRADSFIKEDDFKYWDQIDGNYYRLKGGDLNNDKIKIFLSAIIFRMCNIYEEWYKNYLNF
ncbi:DUF262 domain-containing protein [Flavobacterium haoranii]|uniref:GmrSD restriction endonucleases N-terminal domain-containing protein n=1 Tax=Flavobacterium haoranii TaxID=683124 RepID=A0A1M6BYM9_9FLAO|nr:DUF262 domain-containing protein [Flavobacterium haoranii]SHI53850.1 Protein of unknown function DUF262 [Flavobacterium haoranii]